MTLEHVKTLLSLPGFDPFQNAADKALLLDVFDPLMDSLRHFRLRRDARSEIDSIDARLDAIRHEMKRTEWCASPLAMYDEKRQLHRRRSLLTTSIHLASRS